MEIHRKSALSLAMLIVITSGFLAGELDVHSQLSLSPFSARYILSQ
jgi:hypothetical protein